MKSSQCLRAFIYAGVFVVACAPAQAETRLERGTYLMEGIVACGNCHTPQTPTGPAPGMEMAGQLVIKEPGFTAYAPNISQDTEDGIGAWSDDAIITAIREGVRPDGTIIGPPMPIGWYRNMSDTDVEAIVAYLRTVPAVKNVVPKSIYNFPLPPSYGPPVMDVADISTDDKLAYGAYLAGPLGHCLECHTPMGPDGMFDFENRLGAGGFEFHGPWGVSVSANLTSHLEDGIAEFSDADLKQIITTGMRPDGSRMLPPMGYGYYANISGADLDALIGYLRTLPAKEEAN